MIVVCDLVDGGYGDNWELVENGGILEGICIEVAGSVRGSWFEIYQLLV